MSFVQLQKLHMLFSGVVWEKNENVEQMQWEQRWEYVVCFCTDRAVIWTISVTDLLNMQIGTLNQGLQMYSGKSRDLNWNPVMPICSGCEKSNKVWVIGHVHTECVFPFLYASFPLRAYVNTLAFSSGSQRRRSLSLPVLTLIFPALLPCLVRDSLCTALQTKILWINWSLNATDTETWVSGNLTALTERSQPTIRWRVGEVANRVSCSSFRGGHWYLPIRNHDNRYFADWIRLFPGLSKNSENGNSCPKPHKAARMIEAVGRAVSIETEL